MTTITNQPAKAGQLAGKGRRFGPFGRYAVFPIHTRFAAVEWQVHDAETVDPLFPGRPAIIRQAATEAEAVAGLPETEEIEA